MAIGSERSRKQTALITLSLLGHRGGHLKASYAISGHLGSHIALPKAILDPSWAISGALTTRERPRPGPVEGGGGKGHTHARWREEVRWKRERPRLPTPRGRVGLMSDFKRLAWRYVKHWVDNTQQRILFDSMACDSVIGQLPHATVASINRRSDCVRATHQPLYMATLKAVPGYVPASGFTAPDALQPLHGGKDLVVRLNTNGPFNPSEFESSDGSFDLISLCQAATVRGCKVLFPCQWDGGLCHGCALGVLANLES
eukprot:3038889-Pyramimonas_sp.AAC.1